MRSKLLCRKRWSDESGVSEIVGNILILMITVVLFTGIIAFVNQMPVPQMATKADFSASVAFADSGTNATISVTHIGGEVLDSSKTIVLVSIDSTTYSYRLSNDTSFGRDEWATGITWTKPFSGTDYSSSISVTIVDDVRHSAIWMSQLSGGTGGNPPTILQRYVDSDSETMSIDPIKRNDNFTLYVKISDLDNDLDTVWVDSTGLVGGMAQHPFTRPVGGTVAPEGGWFEWDFNGYADNVSAIDGKILMIHALDAAGHATVVPFKLSVIVLPSDYTYLNRTDTQPGGFPPYIKNIDTGQGYGIFGESDTVGVADTDDPRTTFTRGERVYVRVASIYLSNTFGGNSLKVVDSRTNVEYTDYLDFYGLSTADEPFYDFAYGGNVAIFEAVFDTDDLMPTTYELNMLIQEAGTGTYIWKANETLFIIDPDSPMEYYPTVWLFSDTGYSLDWGYSRETAFNASGSDCVIYVAIHVQDTDSSPSVGEVRIVDMVGGTLLFGPPGSGSMIGTLETGNGTAYVFWVDLRYNNGDLWKSGTNSYTLRISQFSDTNEGVYTYSRQVFIKGFTSRADFVFGTNGLYSTKGGSTNFISPEYVFYVENNNFFTKRTLYYQENAPSTAPLYYHNAMALGDLDNDGDLDLLVGSNMDQTGSYPNLGLLLYFENSLNTYGIWQAPSVITRPAGDSTESKIEWLAMGDINGDGYTDFAYSTSDHKVIIFNNTYGAQGTVFKTWAATDDGIRKLALRDMNGDGRADLVVLAEGKVEVYDLSKWTSGLFAELPNTDVVTDPAHYNIEDFDIADVNNDGMLDIITVDPNLASHSDIEGVWLNNYTVDRDAFDKKYAIALDTTVPVIGSNVGDALSYTETYNDGYAFSFRENTTGTNIGNVSFVLRMDTLSSYTDPQLVVRAKVSEGAQEVFYIWYSVDPNPATAKYTPVIVVSGSSYRDYAINLPASIAGSANFRLKITDSSKQLGATTDQIDIDYIAIESNRVGTFWPNPMVSPSNRYHVAPVGATVDLSYTTARAINLDGLGDDRLEIAVARNGQFAVYDYNIAAPLSEWTVTDANLRPVPTAGTGLSNAVSISPTLFEVLDLNGDGYDDILTAWVSVGDSYEVSLVRAYINVGSTVAPWAVNVKDLFAGFLAGTEKGSLVKIVAGDIYMRS